MQDANVMWEDLKQRETAFMESDFLHHDHGSEAMCGKLRILPTGRLPKCAPGQ